MTTSRPFWQTEACPAWCEEKHYPDDDEANRQHVSYMPVVNLRLMRAVKDVAYRPRWVSLTLLQGYREVEPLVELYQPDDDCSIRMALDEVETLADQLLGLVKLARDGAS